MLATLYSERGEHTMFENFPDALTVKQLQDALSIGRSTAYSLIHSGKLKYITVGRQIRIPKKYLLEYIADSANCVPLLRQPTE